ncbi:MAG: hypothetical protein WCA59_20375 [Candidatus Binataceae bacterium]
MISVRLPEDLARATKVHAAQTGNDVQSIVARALEAYLKAHSRKEVK